MSSLSVKTIEPHEFDTWDEFVMSSPHGTLFHTSAWKRIVDAACAPARLVLIGCFDGFMLVGGCVALDRERYGQRTAVTPIVTPYAGFLLEPPLGEKLSDQTSRQAEVLTALSEWMQSHYPYQNLVNAPHLEDMRPLIQCGYRLTPRFTYLINLKLPAEEIWQRFDGSVRRQIKKAEREGYELSDDMKSDAAYALLDATFRRHGQDCPVSREMFEAVISGEPLRECRQIMAAHRDGQLAAYIVALKFNRTLYYELAATHQDFLSSGVSSLLIWELVKSHACEAWNTFDFVGANIPSIARFKEGFNPRLQMHFQAEYLGDPLIKLGKTVMDLLKR
jgi:hypothetical protein